MNAITFQAYKALGELERTHYMDSYKWQMHPATAARVIADADREALTYTSDKEGGVKLLGIRIERDQKIPKGTMRLVSVVEVQLSEDLQV